MPVPRKTAAQWAAENPVLLATEIGQETDTLRVKRGNNVDPWTALRYDPTIGVDINGNVTATTVTKAATTTAIDTTVAPTVFTGYPPVTPLEEEG